MNFQKILFATDFSAASNAALQCATALARESGATLMITHVEELPPPYAGGETRLAWPPSPNPEIRRMLEAVLPDDPSVRYEHRLVVGRAIEDIVRLANEERVDLIVIGTHGRSGMKRLLMGSVAEAVLRNATCPVLTIRERQ